jgi:hypothetical protein
MEISVIVSQRSENQPLISQPSRFAAAPITTITNAPTSTPFQWKRFFVSAPAAGTATLIA